MYDHILAEAHNQEYRIRIMPDYDPSSPREWDNLGIMICSHRRYNLGDEQI